MIDDLFKNNVDYEYKKVLEKCIKVNKGILPDKSYDKKIINLTRTDEELRATSKKAYNIIKLNQSELVKLLAGFGLMVKLTGTLEFILTLLIFIAEFNKGLEINLTQREAKILYVFYNLGGNFTHDRIKEKYKELFHSELKEIELYRSLDKLESIKSIKKVLNNQYALTEEIIFTEE